MTDIAHHGSAIAPKRHAHIGETTLYSLLGMSLVSVSLVLGMNWVAGHALMGLVGFLSGT
jgi:hypothetical protein